MGSGSVGQVWLFGRRTDLAVFAGSAAVSALLVALAPWLGLEGDTPLWAWALLVLGVDVAHVWSTVFRVYLDREELARRPLLYAGAPAVLYALGVFAHEDSPETFWRLLAYAALYHFVRQQYGWVRLYGRKAGAPALDLRLDALAIYAGTLGPAVWWHANLPRPFWWFVPGDFASGLPRWVGDGALAMAWALLAAWALRQGLLWRSGRTVQVGKVLLVVATWVAWYGGIVLARGDFAFTVMNVVLHGVPYFVLLYRYGRSRAGTPGYRVGTVILKAGAFGFAAFLVAIAYAEELLWDRLVWHERPTLFGADGPTLSGLALSLAVPLLALPQATHYLLDAFIWRPSRDAQVAHRLGLSVSPEPALSHSPSLNGVQV
ncbi:MAG TPA: hypothetical protein VK447_13180 [Myxococcaceae bacterium]|nr:hypothetical protein [Myxococcaceae bacterium]